MRKHAALPEALKYLQPFTNALAKKPPESLNEDIDGSRLEAAICERVAELSVAAAAKLLASDRGVLEAWLQSTGEPEHPAFWVLGYMLSRENAPISLPAVKPGRATPLLTIESPAGWTCETIQGILRLRQRKMFAEIHLIDQLWCPLARKQFESTPAVFPGAVDFVIEVQDMELGAATGKKKTTKMYVSPSFKKVEYLLSIPGGTVHATLVSLVHADFDEMPIESKLHTIRVRAAPRSINA